MRIGFGWQGTLVKLFGEVLDKSGLKDSILSQCQRLVCVMEKDLVDELPRPGTPLIVDLFGIVEHSGIYLGNNRVAELFGDNLLREVTLREFIEGEKGEWVRTGKRIFAACGKESGELLSSEHGADNARAYIRRYRTVKYNLFRNNCHLFSISCLSGVFQRAISVGDVIVRGGISIGVLTQAVQHFLNDGKVVVWKPVKGWSRKELGAADVKDRVEIEYEKRFKKDVERVQKQRCACSIDDKKFEKTFKNASSDGSVFTPCCQLMRLAYETVRDVFSGKRKDIPFDVVGWVVASIVYFVLPIDLIPDVIPVVGYADDAAGFVMALRKMMPYLKISMELYSNVMRVKPAISQWIERMGVPAGGQEAVEVADKTINRDFFVPAVLLPYYKRRLSDLNPPIAPGRLVKMAVGPWTDWEGCATHGWRLQASKLGCRLVDPLGKTYVWGTKSLLRRQYDRFVKWYDDELIPAILNERVGE